MRGFTLYQPMAWAIAEDHKPVENRVWALPPDFVGQRFAVHAGKKYDEPWAQMIANTFGLEVPAKSVIALGAVVAVATFVGCIDDDALEHLTRDDLLRMGMSPTKFDAVHEWYSGPYGFLVTDVRKMSTPIPCRGFQGLWHLPPEVEQAVLAQLADGSSVDAPATTSPAPATPQKRPEPPTPPPEEPLGAPAQLTLIDPVALERQRCARVIRGRAQVWLANKTSAGRMVADALEHAATEIEEA